MNILKTAFDKGFKLPESKPTIVYSVLRAWLEEQKNVCVRSYRSSINSSMYYYSISVDDTLNYHTSQPLYSSRKDAIHSGIDKAIESYVKK